MKNGDLDLVCQVLALVLDKKPIPPDLPQKAWEAQDRIEWHIANLERRLELKEPK
jgi:hypothetical protein